jgi:hypothetical protein
MDPYPDPGGRKTYGSDESGFGSGLGSGYATPLITEAYSTVIVPAMVFDVAVVMPAKTLYLL